MRHPLSEKITSGTHRLFPRHLRLLLACLCLVGLSACGTVPNQPDATAAPEEQASADTGAPEQDNARDPLEGFNRAMYTFNDKFDRYLLKPVAKGYRAITPKPVRRASPIFSETCTIPESC